MTLNLITPLFRSGMLSRMQESIPKYEDINWIVVLCEERDILINECQSLGINYLTINQPDIPSSIHLKTSKAIDNIKPGFYQGLDDDTTFNHKAYEVFKQYQNEYKLIIGQQILQDGSIRAAQKPAHCYTDGAQALIHTDLLKKIRIKDLSQDPVADCNFLLELWEATDSRLLIHEVISNYNFLR